MFSGGPNRQRPFPIHGVDGIVDHVGPHLVELARLGADLGETTVVVPYDLDTPLELVAQDDQRALQPVVDVHRLEPRLVEMAVALHGRHQLRDAARRGPDLADQSFDVEDG